MTTQLAMRLHRALQRAGIPIVGVRIGDDTDRTTWHIFYDDAATDAQMTAGEQLRLTYDPATDAVFETELKNELIDNFKALRAVAGATFELKTTAWTKAQYWDRIKELYRSL